MKTLHASWFRCRIRGKAKSDYPWIYFHVTEIGSKKDLRREGRYRAGLYLHRQIFDFESVICTPAGLSQVKTINDCTFYYQNALTECPSAMAPGVPHA